MEIAPSDISSFFQWQMLENRECSSTRHITVTLQIVGGRTGAPSNWEYLVRTAPPHRYHATAMDLTGNILFAGDKPLKIGLQPYLSYTANKEIICKLMIG